MTDMLQEQRFLSVPPEAAFPREFRGRRDKKAHFKSYSASRNDFACDPS